MYTQEEKNKMAMKNSAIDKFAGIAARRGCPAGMVPDGRGGCKPAIPAPNTNKPPAATVETAEEKAAKAKMAEERRIANLSNKEWRREKKGVQRNVNVANIKEGKNEGKGGKIATAVIGALSGAVGVAEGVKGLLKKEK